MTAATVENTTQHAEPHRFEDDLPGLSIPAAGRPDPGQELEPTAEFKARIKRLMGSVPQHDEEAEVPADDLADRRRETYTRAWRNSLQAAHVEELASWDLDDLNPDQHGKVLRRYIENIGPDSPLVNMILGGGVGSGKTTAAIASGNLAAERGMLVRFVQHATYLRWLRPDGAPGNMPDWQIRKRFRDCDVLVLDDLAAGLDVGVAATKFVRDETTALIGDRIDMGKATIITTNVRAEDLGVMIDDRLVSRLSKRGHALRFVGEDHRGRLTW